MSLGPAEILVILFVALIVFGPQRLPEVARQVGSAMRHLRSMQDTVRAELDTVLHPDLSPSLDAPAPPEEPDPPTEPDVGADSVTADGADDGFAGPTGSFL